tara:strand:+ start:350 stop:1708 length:1359 start_codon:yes stop_codon:yes gene_type:complete
MGYGVSQIAGTISGTSTASPILSTTDTFNSATYNDFDHTNWAWNPNSTIESSALSYTDNPGDAGTFQQRPYHPTSSITGITSTTPIFTFNQGVTRKLAFRTKISGEFTLTFKIIAGGNNPTPTTQVDKIKTSNGAGVGFSHPNGRWPGSTTTNHNVKVAYNTTSFLSGTGTWVAVRSLHGFNDSGSADFNTQQFTQITVTATLPAQAYVGIIQETVDSHHSTSCRWAIADVSLTYVNPAIIAGYNSITVSNFTSHWNEMQRILNGGIVTSDISTTPWVETYHMKPMRFFGSPAPRVEAISGDIHHRFERTTSMLYKGQGEEFMPIHGLATTIHVAPPFLDRTVTALVRCNFLAEESDNEGSFAAEYKDVCDFGLFVIQGNGVPQFISGSMRNLYQEKDGTNIGKKNISIINRVTLSVGINHVYVGIRFAENDSGRGRAHISRKVFVVDVKYI